MSSTTAPAGKKARYSGVERCVAFLGWHVETWLLQAAFCALCQVSILPAVVTATSFFLIFRAQTEVSLDIAGLVTTLLIVTIVALSFAMYAVTAGLAYLRRGLDRPSTCAPSLSVRIFMKYVAIAVPVASLVMTVGLSAWSLSVIHTWRYAAMFVTDREYASLFIAPLLLLFAVRGLLQQRSILRKQMDVLSHRVVLRELGVPLL